MKNDKETQLYAKMNEFDPPVAQDLGGFVFLLFSPLQTWCTNTDVFTWFALIEPPLRTVWTCSDSLIGIYVIVPLCSSCQSEASLGSVHTV